MSSIGIPPVYTFQVCTALLSCNKKVLGSNPGPGSLCMEFVCSPFACAASLWVLRIPPTVEKHDCLVNEGVCVCALLFVLMCLCCPMSTGGPRVTCSSQSGMPLCWSNTQNSSNVHVKTWTSSKDLTSFKNVLAVKVTGIQINLQSEFYCLPWHVRADSESKIHREMYCGESCKETC